MINIIIRLSKQTSPENRDNFSRLDSGFGLYQVSEASDLAEDLSQIYDEQEQQEVCFSDDGLSYNISDEERK